MSEDGGRARHRLDCHRGDRGYRPGRGVLVGLVYAGVQLHDARVLRLDQSRPFVVASLRTGGERQQTSLYLELSNIGSMVACDVQLTFEPQLRSSITEVQPYLDRFLKRGISTLPPGGTVATLVDDASERDSYDDGTGPLSDVYSAVVHYTDRHDRERRRLRRDRQPRPFSDRYVLDIGMFELRVYIADKTIHHVAEELTSLREAVVSLRKSVDALRPSQD